MVLDDLTYRPSLWYLHSVLNFKLGIHGLLKLTVHNLDVCIQNHPSGPHLKDRVHSCSAAYRRNWTAFHRYIVIPLIQLFPILDDFLHNFAPHFYIQNDTVNNGMCRGFPRISISRSKMRTVIFLFTACTDLWCRHGLGIFKWVCVYMSPLFKISTKTELLH